MAQKQSNRTISAEWYIILGFVTLSFEYFLLQDATLKILAMLTSIGFMVYGLTKLYKRPKATNGKRLLTQAQ